MSLLRVNKLSYSECNLRRGVWRSLIFSFEHFFRFGAASITYFGALAAISGAINVGSWYLFYSSVDRFWFPIINLAKFLGTTASTRFERCGTDFCALIPTNKV